ncbi:MAG: hypothetical protein AB7V18_20540, partial [Pyrinomonadaceae bacterium]
PTKTFPKLVMKEWPPSPIGCRYSVAGEHYYRGAICVLCGTPKALSDFTRVLEGVEGQKRPQKEKSRDE